MPVENAKAVAALRKADPLAWSMYLDAEIGAAISDAFDDARIYTLDWLGRFGNLAGARVDEYFLQRVSDRCWTYLCARVRDHNRPTAEDGAEHPAVRS